jgi:hypothetical protein
MVGGKRSGDDDTSKDGVVIQRVIHEVGDGSSYPALLLRLGAPDEGEVEDVGSLEHHRERRHRLTGGDDDV